jgi:hypothetical protein
MASHRAHFAEGCMCLCSWSLDQSQWLDSNSCSLLSKLGEAHSPSLPFVRSMCHTLRPLTRQSIVLQCKWASQATTKALLPTFDGYNTGKHACCRHNQSSLSSKQRTRLASHATAAILSRFPCTPQRCWRLLPLVSISVRKSRK